MFLPGETYSGKAVRWHSNNKTAVVMGDGSSRGGLIMMEKMPAKVGLNS